jgi:hypothetical protein
VLLYISLKKWVQSFTELLPNLLLHIICKIQLASAKVLAPWFCRTAIDVIEIDIGTRSNDYAISIPL